MSEIAGRVSFRWLALYALLGAAAVLAPPPAAAQDLEPRAYSNLPIGLNFIVGGYAYTQGGLAVDPSVPLTDANLQGHTAVVAYVRSLNLFGMSAKFDAIVPYTRLSGQAKFEGQPVDREVSGFNDPRFRLSLNFYGAPALSMEEFARYQQDVIIGASVQVSVPLGQYNPDKLVNLGTNRWFIKPELGISKAWGPVTLEITPSVTFYTTNDDYFGGRTRKQEPLYAVQGHLVYSFGSGIWAALDATYFTGGRTTVDDVEKNDLQRNWRLGATLSVPVDRRNSIKFYGSTGVSTRSGSDFDGIGAIWQYRWGAGL